MSVGSVGLGFRTELAADLMAQPRTVDFVEVVAEASDGAEAIELVGTTHPDVVLMDLSMPGVDGIEATRAILAEHEDVQVVVLTSLADRDRILAALDAGAIGYLLKDAEPDELIGGIRAAARGESPLSPKAARTLLTARAERERAELSIESALGRLTA